MKYSEEVAGKLNHLLEKNYDAEKGYRFAAEKVKEPGLKSFFIERANERHDFGQELKSEIIEFGTSPEEGSSIEGDIMRFWMNLKSHLTTRKEEPILEEVARGDKAAIKEYNEVLKNMNLPASTANVLMKQRNSITAALNRVKSMEIKES